MIEKTVSFIKKNKESLALLGILLIAYYLRLIKSNHVYTFDELNIVTAVKTMNSGAFWAIPRATLFNNPPLYLYVLAFASRVIGNIDLAVAQLGILFSLLSIVLLYQIGSLVNKRVALLASFYMAIMPLSVIHSSWAKQESLLTLLIILSIFFFIKERAVYSSLFLALALLTKGVGFLFMPMIFIFSMLDRKQLSRALIIFAFGVLSSLWWYLIYSDSNGRLLDTFLGKGQEARYFVEPFYFHFYRLPSDVGPIVSVLFLLGCIYFFFEFKERHKVLTLSVIWFFTVYLFFSLATSKAYWYIYAALPAIAIIASYGTDKLLIQFLNKKLALRLFCLGLFLIFTTILMSNLNYKQFAIAESDKKFNAGVGMIPFGTFADAQKFKKLLKPGDRIAMDGFYPNFVYFSSLNMEDIYLLPEEKNKLIKFIERNDIDVVVLRKSKELEKMVLELLPNSHKLGGSMVYRKEGDRGSGARN